MVQQMGGHAYLIHGATMDGEGYPLAQTTRAAPATVSFDNRTVNLTILLYHCSSLIEMRWGALF